MHVNIKMILDWNFFAMPHGKSACGGIGGLSIDLFEKLAFKSLTSL